MKSKPKPILVETITIPIITHINTMEYRHAFIPVPKILKMMELKEFGYRIYYNNRPITNRKPQSTYDENYLTKIHISEALLKCCQVSNLREITITVEFYDGKL